VTKITKESLIDEFLAFNIKSKNIDALIAKFEGYMANDPDKTVGLILYALKLGKAETDQQDFLDCCAIAAPVFEYLEDITNWSYIEFYVLAGAIGYQADYNKALQFFNEALDVLDDEYADDPQYKSIYTALHMNFTLRVVRAKAYNPDVDKDELKGVFMRSYDYAMKACADKDLPHQHVLNVRRGVIEENLDKVESELEKLHKLGQKKMFKITRDEIAETLRTMSPILSKSLMDYLRGYLIRKRRRELNMSSLELAYALETDQPMINNIERGEVGVSVERLTKIAQVLLVGTDYFTGSDLQAIDDFDPFMVKFKARITGATDEDKELILELAGCVLENRYPGRGRKKKSSRDEGDESPQTG
jgi:transcriptional regulator with XRE-family HTH domain